MTKKPRASFILSPEELDQALAAWNRDLDVMAPRRIKARGRMAGQDVIRYAPVVAGNDIEWRQKSTFSPKVALFPPNETLFHLVGDRIVEPPGDRPERPLLLFCRACDIHGVDRLDRVFLDNGPAPDPFYQRRRARLRFALIECATSMENCFCVSMGTNVAKDYSLAIRFQPDGGALVEVRDADLLAGIPGTAAAADFTPAFVQEDDSPVRVPDSEALAREIRENDLFDHPMWEPYSKRCIACGRCNFSCPTCSCFSTLDVTSEDTPELGVRRRVWAGCHVDRFTDMAGGHVVRDDYGSRMRFKTMHKIHDFQQRFGTHMCVGCGRCDDQCPEYISFSTCINRVADIIDRKAEG
ncbi:MAG: anaerobic sulfite reductase subunit AsrA [Lentisphaeria bacterium]|jgi:anaerobic sulfite reductase subunit A|nr:anaerobic sulfite reductase subunit AsrA [Lentisphaeria bacterium]